jgi:hypothetical protein
MHQNMFLTTSEVRKISFYGLDSGGQEMHQNTFLNTPDIKKYFFKNLILVVWKYAQMHQNTFLTTTDVKK